MNEQVMAGRPWSRTRVIGWGCAVVLLALPFVAMQWTSEVNWTAGDFLFLAILIAIVGGLIELAARLSPDPAYRAGFALGTLVAVGLIWVNLAVGILGNEENDANAIFAIVIAVAVGGACLARLRARGMAVAMVAAAVTQGIVGIVALNAGWASPGQKGVLEVVFSTMLFGGAWLQAATLFGMASRWRALDR